MKLQGLNKNKTGLHLIKSDLMIQKFIFKQFLEGTAHIIQAWKITSLICAKEHSGEAAVTGSDPVAFCPDVK